MSNSTICTMVPSLKTDPIVGWGSLCQYQWNTNACSGLTSKESCEAGDFLTFQLPAELFGIVWFACVPRSIIGPLNTGVIIHPRAISDTRVTSSWLLCSHWMWVLNPYVEGFETNEGAAFAQGGGTPPDEEIQMSTMSQASDE